MRLFIVFFILLSFTKVTFGQCDTSALVIHKVKAQVTDPNISFELANHHSIYNPLCTSKNTLLFYMVGTINSPKNDLLFTKMAANHGYHVISLKYINNKSATSICSNDNDTTCYENFHKEGIFGTNLIPSITIDTTNSILNRGEKLLQYLNTNFPTENWGQYLSGNKINWTKVIVAGHSQGSGQAAYLGHIFPVQRVLMFSGPNEYMDNYNRIAPWFGVNNVTTDSNYYSFGNINDEVGFDKQILVWNKLGMNNYGDTINVNNNACPYNYSRMLFTDSFFTIGQITPNHNSTMVDQFTPIDGNGSPIYQDVWKYMLGICPSSTSIENYNNDVAINIYPSPAREHLNIKLNKSIKNATITIYNILGETLLTKNYKLLHNEKIDLNSISSGIYLLNISTSNFKATKKIVIE